MAVALTEQEMQMLASMARSPLGAFYRQLLRKKLQDKDSECRSLDGPSLYRAQGAAQQIQCELDELDEAERKAQARMRPQREAPHKGLM